MTYILTCLLPQKAQFLEAPNYKIYIELCGYGCGVAHRCSTSQLLPPAQEFMMKLLNGVARLRGLPFKDPIFFEGSKTIPYAENA